MNVIAIRSLKDKDWRFLEAKVESAFRGKKRKNGSDMFHHSIDVGRRLKLDRRADDICIFAGYCHDMLEDLKELVDKAYLYDIARATFDPLQTCLTCSVQAVNLVEAVSYSELEYTLGKKERKATASKRWLDHPDYRVRLIKKCDIESNRVDAPLVSIQFATEYLSWAQPLYEKILDSLS